MRTSPFITSISPFAAAVVAAVVTAGCAGSPKDPREAAIVSAIAGADMPLIRSRPALVAGKYARMSRGLFDYYRGTFPLYMRDARESSLVVSSSRFWASGALPLTVGDAHPENFGTLRASDGSFALEPNDFDGADRYPYILDLRRLTVGMALAARLSNKGDPEAAGRAAEEDRAIARAAAAGYAASMLALDAGEPPRRVTEGEGIAALEDLFKRSQADGASRRELSDLTVMEGGARRLRRGVIEDDQPDHIYADLPAFVLDVLPAAIERYRLTLLSPPPPAYFTLLDAVREHGSGVASWPRVRITLLVRGPTDDPSDDVMLELRELADAGAPGWLPPGVSFDAVEARVLGASRSIWARPDADPLWGVARLLGLPVQIKTESEATKTLRVSRMEKQRGTPEALCAIAACLGELLARTHAKPFGDAPGTGGELSAIAAAIRVDPEGFADEQADVSVEYADLVTEDWERFKDALEELGPRLGVPLDEGDEPSADVRELFGHPPPPPDGH